MWVLTKHFKLLFTLFSIRRGREMTNAPQQTAGGADDPKSGQKNDTLKRNFLKQFHNSLRRFRSKK